MWFGEGICEEELSVYSTEVPSHPPLEKVNSTTPGNFCTTPTCLIIGDYRKYIENTTEENYLYKDY